jgi:hypothetical protein
LTCPLEITGFKVSVKLRVGFKRKSLVSPTNRQKLEAQKTYDITHPSFLDEFHVTAINKNSETIYKIQIM